jgi:uncharacterized protein YcbX
MDPLDAKFLMFHTGHHQSPKVLTGYRVRLATGPAEESAPAEPSERGVDMTAGSVTELARFPVKSMAGERLSRAEFGPLGIAGDRRWAVYTEDGGIGSGKTTRRFRRITGLFDLQARLAVPAAPFGEDVPTVRFPDGREYSADDPAAESALSALLGRPLRLRQESSVVHHDESRVHVITIASLRHLGRLTGEPVAAARFRANVVLAVDGVDDDGFVEDAWTGRTLALGDEVRLVLGTGMPRCVMVGLPQPRADLPVEPQLLKHLGRFHDLRFGLKAEVVRGGTVRTGDLAVLLQPPDPACG